MATVLDLNELFEREEAEDREELSEPQGTLEFLRHKGFEAWTDDDGDIVFRDDEGRTYLYTASHTDLQYHRILFPRFWRIDSVEECVAAQRCAAEVTSEIKVAKVFVRGDAVWASIGLFCLPAENFRLVFDRSMGALRASVQGFKTKMWS